MVPVCSLPEGVKFKSRRYIDRVICVGNIVYWATIQNRSRTKSSYESRIFQNVIVMYSVYYIQYCLYYYIIPMYWYFYII